MALSLMCPLGCADREAAVSPVRADCPSIFVNAHGQRFVLIPGGTFQMGPEKPREEDHKPRHEVTLSAFYFAAFEVTKAQFRTFARECHIEERYPELDRTTRANNRIWG